jgi:hypothetical protein
MLAGILLFLCFSLSAMAETETENGSYHGTSLRFSMVPQPVPGQPSYREGSGSGSVGASGTELRVHFDASGMAGGTHFMLVLLANSETHSIANMTTDSEGETEAEGYISLPVGAYSVGLEVLDTSSFSSPTIVMASNPMTQSVTLPVLVTSTSATATNSESTQTISTIRGGQTEDDGIRSAIQSNFIPAVVEVGVSGSSVQLVNGNFSVSVGRYSQGGYLISISGVNGTGPRALLLNATSAQSRGLFSGPIEITLDGLTVQQASSLSQVLSPKAGDPARFIIILTSASLELLITIPHFSSHLVAIEPIIAAIASTLEINVPVLVVSVIGVTALLATVYSRRTRVVV